MDKLNKQWKWVECPVCKNDKNMYPLGCRHCNRERKTDNPGFVQAPADKYSK